MARVVDLETAVDVLGGKIEFETGEEGREAEVLTHLLRTAVAETVRAHLAGIDLRLLVEAIEEGAMVSTGARVGARDFLAGLPVLGESDLYDAVCDRLGATNDGERAGGDRARPRGPLPRPQDRQGHRRRGDRLWLTSVGGRHRAAARHRRRHPGLRRARPRRRATDLRPDRRGVRPADDRRVVDARGVHDVDASATRTSSPSVDGRSSRSPTSAGCRGPTATSRTSPATAR